MEQFFLFLQKSPMNMLLFGAAVASGGMLLWPIVSRPFRGIGEVSAMETVQLINRQDAVVVDLRDATAFKAGHVTGAKSIPEGELDKRCAELEKFRDKPIVFVCRSGNRSGAAAAKFKKQGFGRANSLAGGMQAWEQAGLPVEK